VTSLENSWVAEMNVNLPRGRLKDYMGAHGRSVGGCREFYDCAEKEAFAANVIRAQLLRIRLSSLLACDERLDPRTIPSARMPNLILFVWIISLPTCKIPPGTFRVAGGQTKKSFEAQA